MPPKLRTLVVTMATGIAPLLAAGDSLSAQQATPLPPGTGCPSCSIAAQRVAVISDETTSGEPLDGMPISMGRATDGRIYLVSAQFRPMVFTATEGRMTQLARPGSGPGEFRTPTRVFTKREGGVALLDPPQTRLTVFDARGRLVSSRRIPGKMATEVVLLEDSVLVYNASFNTRTSLGLPFHHIGADGEISKSFGHRVDLQEPADATRLRHRLAPSAGRRFWAASELRYELTEWTASGEQLRKITRRPAWFPGATEYVSATPKQPFTPAVTAIREDSKNRLWLLVAVPTKDFASGLGEPQRGLDGSTHYPVVSYGRHYDTMVDVIDLGTMTVIASQRLPGYFPYFLDDKHIASYDEDEDGLPRVEVWRLSIEGQPSRR